MPKIYSLESTIGGGKTTLLSMLKDKFGSKIEIVKEPIDEWQNIDGINLLDLFYQDPKKYGYMFQTYGFVTRVNKLQSRLKDLSPNSVVIIERSWYSDNNTFAKVLHEDQIITDLQWNLYQKWFNWECDHAPKIDGYIYLRTSVDVAFDRIHKRRRVEEDKIPKDYLEKLHIKHDEWLKDKKGVLIVDGDREFEYDVDRFNEVSNEINEFIRA